MKKFSILLFASILSLGIFSGCESRAEKARREIREANEAYEREQAKLEYLKAKKAVVEAMIDYYE